MLIKHVILRCLLLLSETIKKGANIMNKKTQMVHGGHTTDDYTGAVTTPIYQTSTYLQDDIGDLREGYEYSRSGNPTRTALESTIADLEHGRFGYAFGSGVAAISAVVMLLDKGDHIVVNSDVYGGTFRVLTKVFNRLGIDADFVDTTDAKILKRLSNQKQKC